MDKNFSPDIEDEKNSFNSLFNMEEEESLHSKEGNIPIGKAPSFLIPIFIELIEGVRGSLIQIKNFVRASSGKLNDKEFGNYLNRILTEDIGKIDFVKNSILNYIKFKNVIIKTNTVRTLIEEELKRFQVQLEEKGIKILKSFEKDLPEIAVEDELLRYILNSILQYVITLMTPNGKIWFSTKSIGVQEKAVKEGGLPKKEGNYVEILIAFTDYGKTGEKVVTDLKLPPFHKEEALDIILRLVQEIVVTHHGSMKWEADEKKSIRLILLIFPVERRKVVSYQPTNELATTLSKSKTTFEKLSTLEEMKKRD